MYYFQFKKNRIKMMKKEKFNMIIFDGPKECYIGDLSVIPIELTNNENNIYYEENRKYKYRYLLF